MQTTHLTLPDGRSLPCTIRPSTRAKYMRMQLSADKGLVVTQPLGVSTRQLKQWIHSQLGWISTHLPQIEAQAAARQTSFTLPERIDLPAIAESLNVTYTPSNSDRIAVKYTANDTLRLSGAVENIDFCRTVLQNWLKDHARDHLGRLLQQAAQETGLQYNSYRVKRQQSRWGSCSTLGNINLNYKLMLLPPEWVRYILIHELCHTLEMNHSRRFWERVTQFVPEYKAIHAQMKNAMAEMPSWVNAS